MDFLACRVVKLIECATGNGTGVTTTCYLLELLQVNLFCVCVGLTRIDTVVPALVEVLHAFTFSSRDILPLLSKLYMKMLLFEVGFIIL